MSVFYADTPTRRYDAHFWLRLRRAVFFAIFCLDFLACAKVNLFDLRIARYSGFSRHKVLSETDDFRRLQIHREMPGV
jgi:hypothetical protein